MVEAGNSGVYGWSWEQCDRHLQHATTPQERAAIHCRVAAIALQRGDLAEALSHTQQALAQQPDAVQALRYQAIAQEQMGQGTAALASYDRAIALAVPPDPQLWCDRGNLLRGMGRYADALKSYEQALALDPNHVDALSTQGSLLGLLGKQRQALRLCDRTLERFPTSAQAWHSKGVVLSIAGRFPAALECFDRAIALQPDLDRAWCNRGATLLRMGQLEAGIDQLNTSLSLHPHTREFWKAAAHTQRGYGEMQRGQHDRAIADFDEALQLRPGYPLAALYRLGSLIASGHWHSHLRQPAQRQQMLQNLGTVLNFMKYRLLLIVGIILLFSVGQGAWVEALQRLLSTALSVGVIALVLADLWRNRSRLAFIRRTYFGYGWLPYPRALGIIVATLGTYAALDAIAPPFLRWGWANAVFGNSGNIIFQPFHLFDQSLTPAHTLTASLTPLAVTAAPPAPFNPAVLLILGFWGALLMGIPFWSHLEERIFRRGANTWGKIAIRSTQFGFVHLLAGIPLLGGFVLILPGFLFACRYKFAYHRHLKQGGDRTAAEEAGTLASTTDHAAYNAILVSLGVLSILLATQM